MTLNKQQLNQLYRYCYALTSDRESAYALLQTAVKKYLKHSMPQNVGILPYLRHIIRKQFIIDAQQAQCIAFEVTESTGAIALDTMTLDNILINKKIANSAWSALNAAEREIMYLCSIEGYTAVDISTETKVSKGVVLSRIYRIRDKVMDAFKQHDIPVNKNRVMEE